ncbi:hypothetical protein BVRB_4g086280 [Beta vulgaris subsp. vulgaris]|nr:hypothetical protein BVRB_4g086280 [Beta vulgaris subsp. vulgaris]
MKTSSTSTVIFLALLMVFSFEMESGECQLCAFGTVEMTRCSIPQCALDCRRKVSHSTGRCIAIDTCCCCSRARQT